MKRVTKKDIDFLYKLLKQRETRTNISHKNMPTYAQHRRFVLSKPYRKWYIIIYQNEKIGSVYLTNINEVGLHLKKGYELDSVKKQILKIIFNREPKKRYLVNINPKNKKAIKFFKSQGFNLIQNTYELMRD